MVIRTAREEDTKKIRELWDKCFDDDSIEWRDWYFKNTYKCENVECIFIDNDLVCMVHLNPYIICINGKEVKSFAMAGVATDDSFRKKGYADKLIKHSLNLAYKKGYVYSFLYPFNYEFYEKYGYKLLYTKYSYNQNYSPIKIPKKELSIEPTFSSKELTEIYNEFCKNLNGYVIRDDNYTEKHILEYLVDNHKLVSFSIGDEKGYFIYNNEQQHQIDEMAFTGELKIAYEAISYNLKRDIIFSNQVNMDNSYMSAEPYCMARIINVKEFLACFSLYDYNFQMIIKDTIISDNNITWINEKNRSNVNINTFIDVKNLAQKFLGNDETGYVHRLENASPYIIEVC